MRSPAESEPVRAALAGNPGVLPESLWRGAAGRPRRALVWEAVACPASVDMALDVNVFRGVPSSARHSLIISRRALTRTVLFQ